MRTLLAIPILLWASIALADAPATVTVTLPADAIVTIDGNPTIISGPIRKYVTAPIEKPGKFVFEFESQGKKWKEEVPVIPGEETILETAPPAEITFGVETSRIVPGKLTQNGEEISREKARKLIQATGDAWRPSDKESPYLVVIGQPQDRAAILADLKDKLKAPLTKWRVQEYSPDEWPVAGMGFKTDGKPTVYLQKANGQVMHRQDSYAGPDGMATAIRKADPTYDPKKDPDLLAPSISMPKELPIIPLAGLAGVALLIFANHRKS